MMPTPTTLPSLPQWPDALVSGADLLGLLALRLDRVIAKVDHLAPAQNPKD
jgi:hypothetical protein